MIPMTMMPLEGIRVLDLTRLAPGPFCTMLLGGLGADGGVGMEGFRPGVVKRLGVDYETVSAINPRIVYCSLSGYGQTGPYASLVGHDINYISIGGALGITGPDPSGPPAIPGNIIGDFAGGGLYAAFSILSVVIAREKTGRGQYVDMAMSDGVTSLATFLASMYFNSGHVLGRGIELLNGASPGYNVYETADGGWLRIGRLGPWVWQRLGQGPRG